MPRTRIFNALLVCLALPLLIWPALVNGYPLLFPDTLDYVGQGHAVLYALLHAHHPAFGGMRSALYSLAIYPFHLNRTPWPVLALHATVVVVTVYWTTRSISPRHAWAKTWAILAGLGAFTSLSWYISLLMPDILGAPLYLALYLLTFARPTLSRAEQIAAVFIAVLGATAHSSHPMLAILLLAVMLPEIARTGRSAKAALALAVPWVLVLLCAVVLQLATTARLYGRASLDGNRPPYLEARLLADGPGARYLREHCPDARLPELCSHRDALPDNDDEFLWADGGIWASANPQQQAELLHEERPFAWATIGTYPVAQLKASANNFFAQLNSFGLDDFDNNDYIQTHLDTVLPGGSVHYDRSLQARDAMPWHPASVVQYGLYVVSMLVAVFCVRRATRRLLALAGVMGAVMLLNAFLTGVLSEVDSRYQARVMWLLPLYAGLALLERYEH